MGGRGWYGTGILNEKAARRYLRRKFSSYPLPPIEVRPGARFYVTARDGKRSALLLGPYVSHMTALANVDRGRRLTRESGHWRASFMDYGTASLLTTEPTVFGR